GSQGAVVTSDNGRWVFAVDAGSNDIAAFAVDHDGLVLAGRVSSGGTTPISVTTSGDLVYVLNAGSRTIAGFAVTSTGLSPIAGSPAGLSAASSYQLNADGSLTLITGSAATTQAAACWVAVTNNGRWAFTANAASDSISTFAIASDGSLTLAIPQAAYAAAAHT